MFKYWQPVYEGEGTGGTPPTASTTTTPPAPPADTGETPPAPAAKPWWQERIDQLTREKYELKAKNDELSNRAPASTPPAATTTPPAGTEGLSEAQIAKLVNDRAAALLSENDFNKACNDVYDAGLKDNPDFRSKLDMLNTVSGGIMPRPFIEAALETGKAKEILYHLGSNPELAKEIVGMTPARMAVRLAALATDVGKPPDKPTSSAPPPIKPQVSGTTAVEKGLDDPSLSTAEWMKKRNKEAAERKQAGRR